MDQNNDEFPGNGFQGDIDYLNSSYNAGEPPEIKFLKGLNAIGAGYAIPQAAASIIPFLKGLGVEGAVTLGPKTEQAAAAVQKGLQEPSPELPNFPPVKGKVDGRTVGETVDNMDSIPASLYDYEIQDGIRKVPISAFEDTGKPSFYSSTEAERVQQLADEIKQSGRIDPLIVVVDGSPRGPYILEGGHRFDALKLLGAKSFPALVVHDVEAINKLPQ